MNALAALVVLGGAAIAVLTALIVRALLAPEGPVIERTYGGLADSRGYVLLPCENGEDWVKVHMTFLQQFNVDEVARVTGVAERTLLQFSEVAMTYGLFRPELHR
jgi:hypothetical protein